MDLPYTKNGMYLEFDPKKFPGKEDMEQKINAKGKRLVILLDPHIKLTNTIVDEN